MEFFEENPQARVTDGDKKKFVGFTLKDKVLTNLFHMSIIRPEEIRDLKIKKSEWPGLKLTYIIPKIIVS